MYFLNLSIRTSITFFSIGATALYSTRVSLHSPLDSVSLGWPRSSHRLTIVSSSDNFWWILIRDRLGVPTRVVLETLWPSHPAIAVWPMSNPDSCTFFWHLICQYWGQNIHLLCRVPWWRDNLCYPLPVSGHNLLPDRCNCDIPTQIYSVFAPRQQRQRRLTTSYNGLHTNMHIHAHFDALTCHSNGHVSFPSASVMRR